MPALTGLVKEHELAGELDLTVWALRAWRRKGYGPPAAKLGTMVVYRRADVEAFVAERLAEGRGDHSLSRLIEPP